MTTNPHSEDVRVPTSADAARILQDLTPHLAMLIVGIAGGLGMAALGGWRMRWRR
jgi:hypothetical protein